MSHGTHNPKVANILNGAGLRVLNPALVRTALGLGTIATQNFTAVTITGGSITSASISTSLTATFATINNTVLNASNNVTTPTVNLSSAFLMGQNSYFRASNRLYTTNGSLGNEMLSFVNGEGNVSCDGTVDCGSYDYENCPTDYGCVADAGVDCAAIGDEGECISSGCTPNYGTESCSIFTDEESCNAQSPCSWNGTDCEGDYEVYIDCGGSTASCTGDGDCGLVPLVDCATITGCSEYTSISLTLPDPIDGVLKAVININGSVPAIISTPDNTTFWDGSTSKTLSSFGSGLNLVGYNIAADCAGLDETACGENDGCSWDGSECTGTYYNKRWFKYATI